MLGLGSTATTTSRRVGAVVPVTGAVLVTATGGIPPGGMATAMGAVTFLSFLGVQYAFFVIFFSVLN